MMKTVCKMQKTRFKFKEHRMLTVEDKWIKLKKENRILRLELEKLKGDFLEFQHPKKNKYSYNK